MACYVAPRANCWQALDRPEQLRMHGLKCTPVCRQSVATPQDELRARFERLAFRMWQSHSQFLQHRFEKCVKLCFSMQLNLLPALLLRVILCLPRYATRKWDDWQSLTW